MMSTGRVEAKPPRRVWPWIVVVVVLAAALIAALVWFFATPSAAPGEPTATQATPPAAESPSPTAVADPDPTGCLGGMERTADMVLTAQELAPHTTNGAVEVATAFNRWLRQYPAPDLDGADKIAAEVISEDAPEGWKNLRAALEAGSDNGSVGVVPMGTDYYMTTVEGLWYAQPSSEDRVDVTVGARYVIDGEVSPKHVATTTYHLVWAGDSWQIQGGSTDVDWKTLRNLGTTYTEGC